MPTKHARIAVTRDPELDAVLERVRSVLGQRRTATLVRDLAIRGAEMVLAEAENRAEGLRQLAEWSTTRTGPIDWDVLDRVRTEGWRTGPDEE